MVYYNNNLILDDVDNRLLKLKRQEEKYTKEEALRKLKFRQHLTGNASAIRPLRYAMRRYKDGKPVMSTPRISVVTTEETYLEIEEACLRLNCNRASLMCQLVERGLYFERLLKEYKKSGKKFSSTEILETAMAILPPEKLKPEEETMLKEFEAIQLQKEEAKREAEVLEKTKHLFKKKKKKSRYKPAVAIPSPDELQYE